MPQNSIDGVILFFFFLVETLTDLSLASNDNVSLCALKEKGKKRGGK